MRRTALSAVAVAALVASLAAGCSDGDPEADVRDEPDAPVIALTEEQIAEAVLQDDNLGEGWESEPATESEDAAPGCLDDIGILTEGLDEKAKGGTEFSYGETLGVESTVTAYADETALAAVFEQVQTVLGACSTITGPDADGNVWDVALTYSDAATYDDVDDQYSVSGGGTFTTAEGQEIRIYVEQTAFRRGPNVGSVRTVDLQQRTSEHAAWTEIAVDRFVDVAEGEEPGATTAPAPSGPTA